jgi:hypothetical protein
MSPGKLPCRHAEVSMIMELLLFVALLVLLDVLAMRYGFDSRDRLRSDEDCLASTGFRRDRA